MDRQSSAWRTRRCCGAGPGRGGGSRRIESSSSRGSGCRRRRRAGGEILLNNEDRLQHLIQTRATTGLASVTVTAWGNTWLQLGEFARAESAFVTARAIDERLARRYRNRGEAQRNLALSYDDLGD